MNILDRNYRLILCLIPVLSFFMHYQIFNRDLVGIHVWRQTQTQTVINNFYKEDFNIFHPRINEKPDTDRIIRMEFPVMQWIFAGFHRVFGDSIAVSRSLTFILGLFSVFGMFYLCNNIFKNKGMAALCAWTFNFSPVFYYYTVNPLPDNFALCCAIWSIGFFYRYINERHTLHIVLSALMLCLATLAKLPFIIYGSVILGYLIVALRKGSLSPKIAFSIIVPFIILLLPCAAWYIAAIPTWKGNGVVAGIFDNRPDASVLLDIFQHNLISTLPETLINYGSVLFFLAGFYFLFKNKKHKHRLFPIFLYWSVAVSLYFLFEMNMIGKVHDYYLFPFLPLIFLLVAYGGWHLIHQDNRLLRFVSVLALLILPVTAYLRIQPRWDTASPGFNPIYYSHKSELRNMIPEDTYCVVGNDDSHFILLYYLDRKGWAFDNNNLDGGLLSFYVNSGAKYLFTDSRIDEKPDILPYLGERIYEKENLRVYKLK